MGLFIKKQARIEDLMILSCRGASTKTTLTSSYFSCRIIKLEKPSNDCVADIQLSTNLAK